MLASLSMSPSPSAPSDTVAHELLERARALVPRLVARVDQATALRRIPDETIVDLHDAGLFRAVLPTRYGGYELSPRVLYDLQLELGRGCPSTAWVFGVLSVHSWQLALFPLQAQEEVWGPSLRTLVCSSYMPVGEAVVEDGGVRLSGHWSFSSGCDHCEWVMLGGFVPVPGKAPEMRTFLVPRGDFTIVDNWYVTGLRATGSKDVIVSNAFVPNHRMHRFSDGFKAKSPGNEIHPSPVYRFPFGQVHVRCVSTPALGAAFGALAAFEQEMCGRMANDLGGEAPHPHAVFSACARSAGILDREVLTLRRNYDEMLGFLERGEGIPLERRVRFRYDSAAAVAAAVEVVDTLMAACGMVAMDARHPLNRSFQDVHAIQQHHANGLSGPSTNFGAFQLGQPNRDFFI